MTNNETGSIRKLQMDIDNIIKELKSPGQAPDKASEVEFTNKLKRVGNSFEAYAFHQIDFNRLRKICIEKLSNEISIFTANELKTYYFRFKDREWRNEKLVEEFEHELSIESDENKFRKYQNFIDGKSSKIYSISALFLCFMLNIEVETILKKEDGDSCNIIIFLKAKKYILIIVGSILLFIIIILSILYLCQIRCKEPSFNIMKNYTLSGWIGDIGDLSGVTDTGEVVTFTYSPRGRGPHEWEWKYLDDYCENPAPCKWAGYIFLNPSGNFGQQEGGYNLICYNHKLTFEARCLNHDSVWVTFSMGGISWNWESKKKVPAPYPETLVSTHLSVIPLSQNWKEYSFEIPEKKGSSLKNVKSPLSITISWDNNKKYIQTDILEKIITEVDFTIQIRNIFYHHKK